MDGTRDTGFPDGASVEALGSPLARRAEVHGSLPSTQERARELARAGAGHGTAVLARVQTGGRGRLGRYWASPPGGLWMSLVLRPGLAPGAAHRITPAAAVAGAKALWELGVEARIKWPNDLLVGGRKVCGILAETVAAGGEGLCAVLGIGLNANLDPEQTGSAAATTLRRELGRDVDLLQLLGLLLGCLEVELGRVGGEFRAVLEDWRALECTLGRRVRVRRLGGVLEGTAVDLGPEGALLVRTSSGTVEVFEGEVERLQGEFL
ncbi:Biotin--acetyl-CoA-carboxylase ligase [Rubrobacter xylanophilus DSM 9941]|uniref:biotin--[biotin carboxyl-carrier protein] ligase n=1 Tax=Rubrobacter xylanophilus (strain DSM 9941 / JCM 11954 / NBRC 16129 / PRD-1) TaxID=266117 RepID=Q1ASV2_RUBXD|nr:biotin--[acetyl-CoA-carboxylase] ligase [Rubrobacter xylanophilus]ABG05526.1 Biotin--acetyl-CoA-carboxylase ligase [Rubrobacter xylanophilus DSM 9941]